MPDDAQLLRRYAEEKSEAAFAELVRRHLDLVHSAALRLVGGDAHRAQDVTQIVFHVLARKAPKLIRHPVLAGWLYTATHHAATKVVRAEWRRHVREQGAHAMNELLAAAAPATDWDHVRPVLDTAMRELNDRDREAVLLRFFERRTFADIGGALGLTEDAARMRVERALDKLHALLSRRGVTSTAAALSAVLSTEAVSAAPAGMMAVVCNAAMVQTAVTGGGVTAGLLTFMSTTKFGAIVAVAFAILAAGTATREALASREARASLEAAQANYAAQNARLRGLEQQVQVAEQSRAQLEQTVAEARTAQAAEVKRAAESVRVTAQGAKGYVPGAADLARGAAFLAEHPDVKQALLDRSRARVDSRFRPLYRELNLTPAQIAQFETLLIEGEGVNMTAADGSPLILRPGTGMTRDEMERGVHELLGDAGYQQYQEANRLGNSRGFTLQVAGALYFTDTPLDVQQADQLTRLVDGARSTSRQQRGSGGDYWTTLLAQAGGFLSAPQLEVLAGFQQQEQYQRELTQALQNSSKNWSLPGWGADPKKPVK